MLWSMFLDALVYYMIFWAFGGWCPGRHPSWACLTAVFVVHTVRGSVPFAGYTLFTFLCCLGPGINNCYTDCHTTSIRHSSFRHSGLNSHFYSAFRSWHLAFRTPHLAFRRSAFWLVVDVKSCNLKEAADYKNREKHLRYMG